MRLYGSLRERQDAEAPTVERLDTWLSATSLAQRTVNLLEDNGVYTVHQLGHQDPQRLLQLHTFGPDALTQCQRLVERAFRNTRDEEEERARAAFPRLD